FITVGLLTGTEVLGWFDLQVGSGSVRALAEVTLTLVLFADASRIDLRALHKELALPARLLGIGLPLTIVAGGPPRPAGVGAADLGRGARTCDRARSDGRGPRASGGDRPAPAVACPAGAERGEWAQRWHLRAAALHRARDRRGRRGRGHRASRGRARRRG